MTVYLSANICKTADLTFGQDPKSQRARAGSRVAYDQGAKEVERETLFQIVFLENISHSVSVQFDEIQSMVDIEGVGADRLKYGRQRIVRQVNVDGDNNEQQQQQQQNSINNLSSTFKLTLQDCFGNCCYAIEQEKLSFLSTRNFGSGFPIQLGSKMLVKAHTKIFRGVLMLRKDNVEYLGGIVPEWNQDLQQKHMTYLRKKMDGEEAK